MSNHFTYLSQTSQDQLKQGDLLKKNEEVCYFLEEVHPHYLKPDYQYFLVLTQSCDLIRRGNKPCKARYISIAAVRPFDTVLQRELKKQQKNNFEKISGACSSSMRTNLYQFVERVLNNNHPEYFYLHEDDELDISEACCAFLRLSIAIKSDEHYEKCLNAKFLELTDEFRTKLGWLVGNIYSRVGTKDWAPDFKSNAEFKNIINNILEKKIVWFDPNIIKEIKKYIEEKNIQEGALQKDDILKMAKEIHLPTMREKKRYVLNSIKSILENSNVLKDNINIDKVLLRIESDPVFSGHIR